METINYTPEQIKAMQDWANNPTATIDFRYMYHWKEWEPKTLEQVLANDIIYNRYSKIFGSNSGMKFVIPYDGIKCSIDDDYFCFHRKWDVLFGEVYVGWKVYIWTTIFTPPDDIGKYVGMSFFYPPNAEVFANDPKNYVNKR